MKKFEFPRSRKPLWLTTVVTVILVFVGAKAQYISKSQGLSAVRLPFERFKDIVNARESARISLLQALSVETHHEIELSPLSSVLDLRTSAKKLLPQMSQLSMGSQDGQPTWSEWTSKDTPLEAFKKIRDQRVLKPAGTLFARRPSWLYPDDGCFARAEVAAQELIEFGYPAPNKIFAFGDLEVKTPNHSEGMVEWWYHVVPAYKYRGKILIFDPAIEPQRPLSLKEWLKLMSGKNTSDIELSICDSHAYDPNSLCFLDQGKSKTNAISLQAPYLEREWNRLEELGRNPFRELGEEPPWKSNSN